MRRPTPGVHRARSDGPRRLKPGLELGVTAVGIPVAPEQSLVAEMSPSEVNDQTREIMGQQALERGRK